MSSSSATAVDTRLSADFFDTGKYTTTLQTVDSSSNGCNKSNNNSLLPPKPLLIAIPNEAGEFPLLIFLHGYLCYNSFYSQLIQLIASHGFIVIAPQLYTIAGPDTSDEIRSTASIANWLSEGLRPLLPPHVQPNLQKLGLAGHSRGGKTAFAMVLKKLNVITNLKFSALIGVDPVDGLDKGKQTPPPVLTYVPQSFHIGMAVMVIGSELGELKRNPLFPPCAPKGVNHEDFYNECERPAFHFVAKDYGHTDMLDDDIKGIRGKATYCLCKNGQSREPMRRFVGGIIVAFLKSYLQGDDSILFAIIHGHVATPVELKTVEFIV